MPQATNYTGHGARTGGLQAHSCGPMMPYMIQAVGRPGGLSWQVLDSRSGSTSRLCHTYRAAEIEMSGLRVRNMMHS